MDNATEAIIAALTGRIAALEAQIADFRREVRTERVVVSDEKGRERITLQTGDEGDTAELYLHHPTIDAAFVALIAGCDDTVAEIRMSDGREWTQLRPQRGLEISVD